MARKYSRQREVIKRFLSTRKDHPSADTVYTHVREELPNISLGTVYRNLMLLSDDGEILKLDVGDGIWHFDPDISDHYHFVCDECGVVEDIPFRDFSSINEAVSDTFAGKITGHKIYFQGICQNCIANEKGKKGVTL